MNLKACWVMTFKSLFHKLHCFFQHQADFIIVLLYTALPGTTIPLGRDAFPWYMRSMYVVLTNTVPYIGIQPNINIRVMSHAVSVSIFIQPGRFCTISNIRALFFILDKCLSSTKFHWGVVFMQHTCLFMHVTCHIRQGSGSHRLTAT